MIEILLIIGLCMYVYNLYIHREFLKLNKIGEKRQQEQHEIWLKIQKKQKACYELQKINLELENKKLMKEAKKK